jgi:hypothetical protein
VLVKIVTTGLGNRWQQDTVVQERLEVKALARQKRKRNKMEEAAEEAEEEDADATTGGQKGQGIRSLQRSS